MIMQVWIQTIPIVWATALKNHQSRQALILSLSLLCNCLHYAGCLL